MDWSMSFWSILIECKIGGVSNVFVQLVEWNLHVFLHALHLPVMLTGEWVDMDVNILTALSSTSNTAALEFAFAISAVNTIKEW